MSSTGSPRLSKAEQTENKMEGIFEYKGDPSNNTQSDDSFWVLRLPFPLERNVFIKKVEKELNKGKVLSPFCHEVAIIQNVTFVVQKLTDRCMDFGDSLMDIQQEIITEYDSDRHDPLKCIQLGRSIEYLDPILNEYAAVLEKIES